MTQLCSLFLHTFAVARLRIPMYLNAAPGGRGAGSGETKHMPSFIQVTAKVNHMAELLL